MILWQKYERGQGDERDCEEWSVTNGLCHHPNRLSLSFNAKWRAYQSDEVFCKSIN